MLIRILTSRENIPCGTEIDIEDGKAAGWVSCGDAEPVAPPAAPLVVDALIADPDPVADAPVVVETAVADAPVETRKKGKK